MKVDELFESKEDALREKYARWRKLNSSRFSTLMESGGTLNQR